MGRPEPASCPNRVVARVQTRKQFGGDERGQGVGWPLAVAPATVLVLLTVDPSGEGPSKIRLDPKSDEAGRQVSAARDERDAVEWELRPENEVPGPTSRGGI